MRAAHGVVASGVVVLAVACDRSPTEPSSEGPGSGSNPNVITITATGVRPTSITILVGERVLFINNDGIDHEMSSDDHPTHERCPQINQVGYLRPGDARETGNFTTVETCAFHDHINAQNDSLDGTIVATE